MNLVKHIDGIKQIKTIKQKGQNEKRKIKSLDR